MSKAKEYRETLIYPFDWKELRYTLKLEKYCDQIEQERDELKEALSKSIEVIKQWHGDEVFDTYYNHAPEMKTIREANEQKP